MEELIDKLKIQIIDELHLEDIKPEDIGADTPLFGEEGLGLDSIDALELMVSIEKNYGIKIQDPKNGRTIFYSVRTLAEYITAHKKQAS